MDKNREKLAEAYLKASEAHRQRLTTLHTNEWQIAIVLWSAVAGSTAISVVNADALFPLPRFGIVFLALAYLLIGAAYLFGFCRSNYRSLTTERKRYLYFQNQAMLQYEGIVPADLLIETRSTPPTPPAQPPQAAAASKPGNPLTDTSPTAPDAFLHSAVWRFKFLSTSLITAASLIVVTNLDRIALGLKWWDIRGGEYVAALSIHCVSVLLALYLNRAIVGEVRRAIAATRKKRPPPPPPAGPGKTSSG